MYALFDLEDICSNHPDIQDIVRRRHPDLGLPSRRDIGLEALLWQTQQ